MRPPIEPLEEDRRFLAALQRRDERAFNRLVLLYQDRVYQVIYRLLGSREEARDVAQDVFVTVFQRIGSYRGEGKLSTWIYRVAANQAKNRIKYLARRHDRQRDSYEELLVPPSNGRLSADMPRPDQEVDGWRLERFLQRALGDLDPDQRAVVVLRDVEGLAYEEIAEVVDASLGTVKSRLHRGRERLKMALQRWMAGDDPTGERDRTPGSAAAEGSGALAPTVVAAGGEVRR